VALHESHLRANAVGSAGERGIMQLHPRWFGHVRFVDDPGWRRHCAQFTDGECQAEVIEMAAKELRLSKIVCRRWPSALGRYNRGNCNGNPSYSRKVLRILQVINKRI
jgi:soluble lytic murein transglycosylase-like protein